MFKILKMKYSNAKGFMSHFEQMWLEKVKMWVAEFRNASHANQDTNTAVERYHSNMKSIFAKSRQKLDGRHIDWLMYHLVGDILTHYWYAIQGKLYVKNTKAEGVVACVVLRARDIPDAHVHISKYRKLALVAS